MIPAQAVEAAMIAFANAPLDPPTSLAQMNLNNQAQMTLALEAAAPHMRAAVSTLDALVLLEPGTVLQGPDFHEETYKCTAPGTFHAIASTTEYRASELVGRGPFTIIYSKALHGDD